MLSEGLYRGHVTEYAIGITSRVKTLEIALIISYTILETVPNKANIVNQIPKIF